METLSPHYPRKKKDPFFFINIRNPITPPKKKYKGSLTLIQGKGSDGKVLERGNAAGSWLVCSLANPPGNTSTSCAGQVLLALKKV